MHADWLWLFTLGSLSYLQFKKRNHSQSTTRSITHTAARTSFFYLALPVKAGQAARTYPAAEVTVRKAEKASRPTPKSSSLCAVVSCSARGGCTNRSTESATIWVAVLTLPHQPTATVSRAPWEAIHSRKADTPISRQMMMAVETVTMGESRRSAMRTRAVATISWVEEEEERDNGTVSGCVCVCVL